MSKSATEFIKKLQAITKGDNNADVFVATVEAVNDDGSIDVKDTGDYEYTCRSQAINGLADGIKLKPTIGSVVLVEKIGTDTDKQYAIIMFSSLDEVSVTIAGYKYLLNNGGHLLASPGGDTLLEVLTMIIESVQQIKIYQGTNPDFIKLTQAKTKASAILQ